MKDFITAEERLMGYPKNTLNSFISMILFVSTFYFLIELLTNIAR